MKSSINILLLGLLLIFIGWNAKPDHIRKDLVSVEKIRVTGAGQASSWAQTTADVVLVIDISTTTASATCTFPTAPVDGQVFGFSTRSAVTTLTLSAGAIPISGPVTTAAAGAAFSWVYDQGSNRWFRNP